MDSYKIGDRIFAKIRGYPHWPAQVTERRPGPVEEYCVAFYGSHEIAYVKPNMMCLYNEESIKKYAVGFSSKKKSARSSILTFQKAMDECAAHVNFIPVDLENQVEENEEDEWQDESPSVDPLAAKQKIPEKIVDRRPKRGRPRKSVALENLNVTSTNEGSGYSNGEPPLNHDYEADTQVITPSSDSDVEIPIIVTNVESLSDKIQSKEVEKSPASVEEVEPEEVMNQPSEQGNIVSRSGRKIKPKIFADSEVDSPVSEYLKSALSSSRQSPQKKRKASFDEPVEVAKKIALEKQMVSMPIRKPRKSGSISVDSEDGNISEQSTDTPEIIKVKRGSGKRRFLATVGGSASISWKEEAMRPLQDKLIKSCKRLEIENLKMQGNTMPQSVITTPVRDKLAAASVAPIDIPTAPLSQPLISKSMAAIAKTVAGDSSKRAKAGAGSTSSKKSVGTSTTELKEALTLQVPPVSKSEGNDCRESEVDESQKKSEDEAQTVEALEVGETVVVAEAGETVVVAEAAETVVVAEAADTVVVAEAADTVVVAEAADTVVEAEAAETAVVAEAAETVVVADAVSSPSDVKRMDVNDSIVVLADDKRNLINHSQPIEDTPRRVTFGGTVTKDLNISDDDKMDSSHVTVSKRKTSTVPSSIMKKARFESPEKKKDDTLTGRSHLQRRVELPLRYKDSVAPSKEVSKSGLVTKKSDSPSNSEAPVNANSSSDDSPKSLTNGFNGGADTPGDKLHTNGLKVASESEEDENVDLTEADFPDDQTKQRIQKKAQAVMETVVTLINSALETDQNLDVALEMLVKLGDEGFVDKVTIKAYPDIVHVVRKMLNFVGNPKALRLNKAQKAEFPKKAEKIREQAKKTLESFKELMTTNTKPLAVLIMEEMRRQNSDTQS